MESPRELPPNRFLGWGAARYLGNGYLASDSAEESGLAFLYIPPIASQKPVESWTIPPFSFPVLDYAAYPPENLLAVPEINEKCVTGILSSFKCLMIDRSYRSSIRIHLLHLRDGSPHHVPPSDAITWKLPSSSLYVSARGGMAITGSRIMMCTSYWDGDSPQDRGMVWKIAVWDWRTGGLVRLPPLDQ